MKLYLIILLLITHFLARSQNLIGKYLTPDGYEIEIKNDSTFYSEYSFCVSTIWERGLWSMHKDTILFQPNPIYDTVYCNAKDSIILSWDIYSNRLSCDSFIKLSNLGLGTRQNYDQQNFKLLLVKKKLFYIGTNGKPVLKVKRPKRIVIRKGRIDGSGSIIIRYKRKYSGEIVLLSKENCP
ncbi:MAG: hypothetical protein ACOVOQ_05210 [Flavobacterium sp.]